MSAFTRQLLSAGQYIEDHLGDDIGLADIARHVRVSPYHFHRIFRAFVGDSPMEFVRKRRLTEAALALTSTRIGLRELLITVSTRFLFTAARWIIFTTPLTTFGEVGFRKRIFAQSMHLILNSMTNVSTTNQCSVKLKSGFR